VRDGKSYMIYIIGCAIDVHRALGPGVPESAHERCLAHKFQKIGLTCNRQVPLPITL
jgi:GxxExxY protein